MTLRPTRQTLRAAKMRQKFGTTITFRDRDLKCFARPVADNLVGTRALSTDGLGVYVASADPHEFDLSPIDFQPYIDDAPPLEGEELIWHELRYLITHVTYSDIGRDTHSLLVYAYRRIDV